LFSAPQSSDVTYLRVARLSGDRDAESRVEDHLLIPFRQFFRCSSSGEDEPSASDIKSTVADAAADVESVASGEQEDATDSTVDEVAKL
jgi:hypothetical protein